MRFGFKPHNQGLCRWFLKKKATPLEQLTWLYPRLSPEAKKNKDEGPCCCSLFITVFKGPGPRKGSFWKGLKRKISFLARGHWFVVQGKSTFFTECQTQKKCSGQTYCSTGQSWELGSWRGDLSASWQSLGSLSSFMVNQGHEGGGGGGNVDPNAPTPNHPHHQHHPTALDRQTSSPGKNSLTGLTQSDSRLMKSLRFWEDWGLLAQTIFSTNLYYYIFVAVFGHVRAVRRLFGPLHLWVPRLLLELFLLCAFPLELESKTWRTF